MDHPKTPGPQCAGRTFTSEQEAAEATECPVAMFDGTACAGPDCACWRALPYDPAKPAEGVGVVCLASMQPRAIGAIRPAQEGARR